MDDIVIFPSRKKLALLALGALAFVAAGVFIITEPSMPWVIQLLGGYLGVGFFGICLGYAALRLVRPVPSLVISKDGVFENASAIGAGMLRWSEIADVKIYSFMNQRFLGIVPKNLDEVLQRQNTVKRWLMRVNRGLVEAPFNVPESALPVTLEEILSQISARRSS